MILFVTNGLSPLDPGETVRLEIAPGMHSSAIAERLEEEGIIRNATIFSYYVRYKNEGSRFQAGVYDMHPGMTHDEIIAKLNAGDTVEEEMIRFTVPEGFTVAQIAERLAAHDFIDKETFLELTQRPDLFHFSFLEQIPDDPDIKFRLEGYLFPETYELKAEADERQIIARMIEELERKLAQLPPDWRERMEERGLDLHQLLTIASLIEREVAIDEERPIVAGVIYNRLERGMMLQIDATVQYLFDEQLEIVEYRHLEIDDPYNTYERLGLPPGPIASVGLRSIEAALYPEETSYLFYVTKKDGSREHYFAETFEEHQRNIELSRQASP